MRLLGVASLVALGAVMAAPVTPGHAQAPAGGEPGSNPPPPAVTEPEVILDGKGYGHGVGMAQDGAYAMGMAGAGTEDILATFYPGTTLGEASGTVSVSLDPPQPAVELVFPEGGEVRDAAGGSQAPGFPVTVAPGGTVRLTSDGGLSHAFPLSGASPAPTTAPPTTAPPPTVAPLVPGASPTTAAPATTTPPPEPTEPTSSSSLWAVPPEGAVVTVAGTGHRYRGVLEASGAGGGLQLFDHVDVEEYLRGMGEILDPGWPAASLQAQAIAARTYALRSGGGVLCSTDQCQVYLGATAEYGAMDAAVTATSGQVLRYGGSLADTVYSANGGGHTASPEEGFGGGDHGAPYLQAVPYPTRDPEPWNVRSTLAAMAGRFGYGGTATGAHVTRTGPSGRALEVVFEGDRGPLAVDGLRFQTVLQLRSTLFTLRIEEPPPPPPPGESAGPAGDQRLLVSPPPGAAAFTRSPPLNRRPWIALALVLVMVTTSAATRVRAAGRQGPGRDPTAS